jgi:hypothetical protein
VDAYFSLITIFLELIRETRDLRVFAEKWEGEIMCSPVRSASPFMSFGYQP